MHGKPNSTLQFFTLRFAQAMVSGSGAPSASHSTTCSPTEHSTFPYCFRFYVRSACRLRHWLPLKPYSVIPRHLAATPSLPPLHMLEPRAGPRRATQQQWACTQELGIYTLIGHGPLSTTCDVIRQRERCNFFGFLWTCCHGTPFRQPRH